MTLHLVVPGRTPIPVPAVLSYDSRDPYAISMTMMTGPNGEAVEWVFARQLLVDGVVTPTGEGDVHVWPKHESGQSSTFLSLTSPSGAALLEASTGSLVEFLTQTLHAVPPGTEGEMLNLDQELATLLPG